MAFFSYNGHTSKENGETKFYKLEDYFGDPEETKIFCNNGVVNIYWLKNSNINTQNRAYQREKVSTEKWKQAIMRTVLGDAHAGIPEIHIRVIEIKDENNTPTGRYRYELIDGQQRITAVFDYLKGEYTLPENMEVDGQEIGGMHVEDLRNAHDHIYDMILQYEVSCKWYEYLSDQHTADLFIDILNNVNDMKQQEFRNAILGKYSDYVRNTARFPETRHELFNRYETTDKNGVKKEYLTHFSPHFPLRGRMEVDEWLSKLLCLISEGITKGISHPKHKKWVKDIQSKDGKYETKFVDKKKTDDILNFALTLLTATPTEYKTKLNAMTSQMLVLYAYDLLQKGKSVNPNKYTKAFFDIHTRWSDTKAALYRNETTANGNQMPPFNELFGGDNGNAIQTIFNVLDKESENGLDFGIIKIDLRKTFSRSDIMKKWQEQGGKCAYTGDDLDEKDIAGDHDIPRSWGIALGGVTEYDNLKVTSKHHNRVKSNMSGDEYKKKIA